LIETLLASPWQVSILTGIATWVGLKWIFPALAGGNMFLKPISAMASSIAWLFAGAFFLIGAIAFAKERRQAVAPAPGRTPAARHARIEPSGSPLAGDNRTASAAPTSTPKPSAWSLDLIRDLEWKRFEDVCQQFYELKGIRSETTALGPDGGIDIRLFQDASGNPTSVVQCKAWGERFVGVKPVRELLGVMTHEKIGKAFFMTSGAYSDEAKAVAQANRITLIDGNMLLMMIQRLPPAERERLLAFATAGDYTVPTCPACGVKMKAVEGKGGRADFWGCRNHPDCHGKLGMRGARPRA
jgi:restriction system protein